MTPEDDNIALQLAVLLADWRYLRRDQIAMLLAAPEDSLDGLLADLAARDVVRSVPTAHLNLERSVYALGRGGAALAASHLGIDRAGLVRLQRRVPVGPLFLQHTLAVNDIRLAFHRPATGHPGHALLTWRHDREIADRVPHPARPGVWLPVWPDGYLVYQAAARRIAAFIEADRGTVTNKRWMARVQAYVAYRLSGRFRARYGVPSFRVLTVTTTERRLANLLHATQEADGRRVLWFTTFAELSRHSPLAPIWSVAGAASGPVLSHWWAGSVRRIVINETYAGIQYFHRQTRVNNRITERPCGEWIAIPVPPHCGAASIRVGRRAPGAQS